MPNSLLIPSDQEPGGSGGAWHTRGAQAELFLSLESLKPFPRARRESAEPVGPAGNTNPWPGWGGGLTPFLGFFWDGNVTEADQGRRWFDLL